MQIISKQIEQIVINWYWDKLAVKTYSPTESADISRFSADFDS